MDRPPTFTDVLYAPEKPEMALVRDVTGNVHRIRVSSVEMFMEMLKRGGGHPDNWIETAAGGLVRQGALASVMAPSG